MEYLASQSANTIVFNLATQKYGFSIASVLEVVNLVSVIEIPNMPPSMLGLLNYRGNMYPLIDLRMIFEFPPITLHLHTPVLIIHTGKHKFSVVVDAIEGVMNLPDQFTSSLKGEASYLLGIKHYQNETILMMDLDAVANLYSTILK